MLKISVISRVRRARRVKLLIFSRHEMKYFWYLPKKKFFFFFSLRGKNFFLVISPYAFSGYNIGCKHSLHLENGLKCHLNEWIKRNLQFKKAS